MKFKFLLFLLLALSVPALAQTVPGSGDSAGKAEGAKQDDKSKKPDDKVKKQEGKLTAKDYEEMLARLKRGDTSIDFVKFRLAYTETKEYKPYGGGELRSQMMKALEEDKFKDALKFAEKMMETNYCDLHAHFTASAAMRELGREDEAKFHKAVFKGLIDAIMVNDGLTAKTGMIALGISEQYFVMSYLGFRQQSKGLVQENGSMFDVHTSYNEETKETRKFYFNIDKVFGRF
jgi:hypothetical protein